MDEPPSDPLSEADRAIARRLIDEINQFNLATTGIAEVHEILKFETDSRDELTGGVYGWCWGGTCWIDALWRPVAIDVGDRDDPAADPRRLASGERARPARPP